MRHVLNIDKYVPSGHRQARRHRGILAITFTNKATAEMKARIVQNLNELAAMPEGKKDNGYVPALLSLYGCTRAELAQAASMAVKELLCDYSQFNISTIDSFFQSVLRVFAREVNHQGDYAVQLDDADAVGAGIGLMLDDINNGSHPSATHLKRWIDTLMARKISDGSRFNVFDADSSLRTGLRKFVEKMCGETFRRHAPEMEAYLSGDKIRRLGLALAAELDTKLPDACRRLAASFAGVMDAHGVDSGQMKNNFGTLLDCLAKGEVLDEKMAGQRAPVGFLNWLELNNPDNTIEREKLFTKSRLPKDGRNPIYPSESFVSEGAKFAAQARELYLRHKIISGCLTACYNLEFLGYASQYID
ncbi:MAG: UvrD-helicase domain-containing protein, partial [Paramuribaculum sp.]|nr:UvrD-helicase domain-containing protein [Paramuribaculum sp.]